MTMLADVVRADLIWLGTLLLGALVTKLRARPWRLRIVWCLAVGWVCVEILFHWYMEEGVARLLLHLGL